MRSSAGSSSSGLVDCMAGGRLVLIPEPSVLPGGNDCTFGRVPIGVVTVTGFLGEPVVDTIEVRERFEGIDEISDERILSGDSARPHIPGVIIDACGWPVLEVIGALDDMYPFGREERFEVVDGVDEVVLVGFGCHLRCGQIAVPEGIVTKPDDVKIDAAIDKFVVIETIVTGVRRSIGMDDDLGIRTFLPYGVTTGIQEPEIAGPVITALLVWMYLDTAHAVHDLITYLNEIRRSAGSIEGIEHAARVCRYAIRHGCIRSALPSCRSLNMRGIHPSIGIMEIEHEERPCVLDALAERLDISEVLTNGGIGGTAMIFLRRVDKNPDAESVPSAVVDQESDQIRDIIASDVFIG